MKRLICWFNGHIIKATIQFDDDMEFRFHCERCGRMLPGPRRKAEMRRVLANLPKQSGSRARQ